MVIEMRCLKPRIGLSTFMEETTDHLLDMGIFKIQDDIDSPSEVLHLRGKKWDITMRVLLHTSEKYLGLIEKP